MDKPVFQPVGSSSQETAAAQGLQQTSQTASEVQPETLFPSCTREISFLSLLVSILHMLPLMRLLKGCTKHLKLL